MMKSNYVFTDSQLIKRLEKDAQAVQTLSDSPNVLTDMDIEKREIRRLAKIGGSFTYYIAIRLRGVEGGETIEYVKNRLKYLGKAVIAYKIKSNGISFDVERRINYVEL